MTTASAAAVRQPESVVRAILLDDEARWSVAQSGHVRKLREPLLKAAFVARDGEHCRRWATDTLNSYPGSRIA
jgi:hypothetical protein